MTTYLCQLYDGKPSHATLLHPNQISMNRPRATSVPTECSACDCDQCDYCNYCDCHLGYSWYCDQCDCCNAWDTCYSTLCLYTRMWLLRHSLQKWLSLRDACAGYQNDNILYHSHIPQFGTRFFGYERLLFLPVLLDGGHGEKDASRGRHGMKKRCSSNARPEHERCRHSVFGWSIRKWPGERFQSRMAILLKTRGNWKNEA